MSLDGVYIRVANWIDREMKGKKSKYMYTPLV